MSLKRKFKNERSPLVNVSEVKRFKEKFGSQVKKAKTSDEDVHRSKRTVRSSTSYGEDEASMLKHIQILEEQFQKAKPDKVIVEDKMIKTFSYRQKEISYGLSVGKIIEKTPFLATPTVVRCLFTPLKKKKK
ncbi:sterile alpha motif domain-containing protein 3-like isoform X1 [Acipenser oxyrinchus oxyrinchus]|uniref:Sterile alpha motif domain-containing protein 3-like isoform X1 n=1 Tax=Acipenser oxyrinchus oxyrinchus TaxID=40147 RepID=A0AAD8G3F2_ACIOX|nr:sterile alpha motif domain-containing protein 3-like isoform X1 [Acipenser oxyrinchus oxyrinchus]